MGTDIKVVVDREMISFRVSCLVEDVAPEVVDAHVVAVAVDAAAAADAAVAAAVDADAEGIKKTSKKGRF